ncbi:phosphodiester glycosidase family protein [Verrucomicrobiaceae bacterium N1E253]|uniref:Phosphodiester glycosidase family protein n=1 Tax=Oceaniferula marina TaxID=2748318 RepID=A0A851GL25_9BACT|nr:phosphodiester glycosidase family protein [Oceaniferula marina]NWK54864.1 phosphodiester glycosidase family protein [Oceaniferula marina]
MTPRYGSVAVITLLSLVSCSTNTQQQQRPPNIQPPSTALPRPASTPAPEDPTPEPAAYPPAKQARCPLRYHHTSRNGIVLSLVSFDDRQFRLQVADQANGPGSIWRSSEAAAAAHDGIAAINGGFFTPEGKPLGLVVSRGKQGGYVNKSSLGTGLYLSTAEVSRIVSRQSYQHSPGQWGKVQDLLQTGPYLCRQSQPVSGLSSNSQRPRSFIAWDGQHHWAIGHAANCSLKALSAALAGKAPAGFAIHTAINLDGGRSSDLWVGSQVENGNHTHRGFLNKPVRNYLILKPK